MKSYTFRVVPDENYTIDNVVEIFSQTIPKVSKLIICSEGGCRNVNFHLHISLVTPHSVHSVQKYKRTYFPLWNHTRNENFTHHPCDSCQSEKHGNCVVDGKTYTCKDGNVVFSQGYTSAELAELVSIGSSYDRKIKTKKEDPIHKKIIKLLPHRSEWLERKPGQWIPYSHQVKDALVAFYGKRNKHVPPKFYVKKTLHQIRMDLDSVYRDHHYLEIQALWQELEQIPEIHPYVKNEN